MAINQQIVEHAKSLFDVFGVSQLPSTDSLLILRLKSTPEQDLANYISATYNTQEK